MHRTCMFCLCLLLALPGTVLAKDKATPDTEPAAKQLSGMSIVGNDEAPKALYIVPWKSSDIGARTSLNMMLDASDAPVDRDVFKRQLDFYEQSSKK